MTRSVAHWLKSKTIQRCTGDLMESRKLCETILYFKVKTLTVLSGQSTLSGGQSWVILLPPKAFVMILGGASQVTQKQRNCLQCRGRRRHGFDPWVRKLPWRRAWQSTPVLLPGETHGQRILGAMVQRVEKRGKWLSTHTHTHAWYLSSSLFQCPFSDL